MAPIIFIFSHLKDMPAAKNSRHLPLNSYTTRTYVPYEFLYPTIQIL